MSQSVQEVLTSARSSLTEDDLIEILVAANRGAQAAATPLSGAEATLLLENSGLDDDRQRELKHEFANPELLQRRAERHEVALAVESIETSYSAAELAAAVHKNPSTISRRQSAGHLYSFELNSRTRFPGWQVSASGIGPVDFIQGLDVVVPAIPWDTHPLAVEALMTSAADELDGQTPIEWLETGGSPTAVTTLLEGLSRLP